MSLFIKEIRKRHDLTQSQLADILGVTRSAIAQIESGKNKLSSDLSKKLAQHFGIKLSDIESANHSEISQQLYTEAPDVLYYNSFYMEKIMLDGLISEIGITKLSYIAFATEHGYKIDQKLYNQRSFALKLDDLISVYNKNPDLTGNRHFAHKLSKALDECLNAIKSDLCRIVSIHYRSLNKYYEENTKQF